MRRALLALIFACPGLAIAQEPPQFCTLNISGAVELLFGVPAVLDMSQAFALGFVPPMTTYLAGYVVGVIVNFWNHQ